MRGHTVRRMIRTVALGIVLVQAACTPENATPPAQSDTPQPSLRAPSSTPLSDTPAAAAQKALDAYRGMWAAYTTALHNADPNTPALSQFASDVALTTLVNAVTSVQQRRLRGRGQVSLTPEVTSLTPADTPTQAEIRDCADTSGTQLYRPSPGPPYADTPGGRRLVIATAKNVGGVWKVTGLGVREVGTC